MYPNHLCVALYPRVPVVKGVFKRQKRLREFEKMEGSHSDRTREDTEDTEDTTMFVQIEEGKCAIRNLSYVTKLSRVQTVNGTGPGWQVSLSCSRCQEYDNCPKKQDPVVLLARVAGSSCRMCSICCPKSFYRSHFSYYYESRYTKCATGIDTNR